MAEVYPFHGYRYNSEKVKDLNLVITQPYDKINQQLKQDYYLKSDYNIVKIILPDGSGVEKYKYAAEKYINWLENDILIREEEPCFYIYWQEYIIEGKKYIRKGFIGMGKLAGEEGVKAHENTMEGPKADRLNLMRATESNFGHIFMLYSDPEMNIINLLDQSVNGGNKLLEVDDEDDNRHIVWKVNDKVIIEKIKEAMADKTLYIADGHHRYQTAVNYRNECQEKGWQSVGAEGFENRLMTFININDPGMNILATHRLVYGLKDFKISNFLSKVKDSFIVDKVNSEEELFDKLDTGRNIIGFVPAASKDYYSLTLKGKEVMAELLPDKDEKWRNLDVVVLHKALLERYLKIDEKALAEKRNIDYVRYRSKALEELNSGKYQAVFLLNPTAVEEVKEVADRGDRMPQKSTDFYPKLLTGLVLNKLNIQK